MIIPNRNGRKELDACMNLSDNTLLLLTGSMNSKSKVIHDGFYKNHDPWQFCFLITDVAILSPDELDTWFNVRNIDQYAVIGGELPKKVAKAGPITELILEDNGDPDYLAIRDVVLAGDEL